MWYPFEVTKTADLRKHGHRLVDISALARFDDPLSEGDLARLLEIVESHARRHRTGTRPLNAADKWPDHYRDPVTSRVFYKRAVVKKWLARLPAAPES